METSQALDNRPPLRRWSEQNSVNGAILPPKNKIATKNIFCALKFMIVYRSAVDKLSGRSMLLLSLFTAIYRLGYVCLSSPLSVISEQLSKFGGSAVSQRTFRRCLVELEATGYIQRRQCRLGEYSGGLLINFTSKLCELSDKNLHRPKMTDARSYNNCNNLDPYIDKRLRETTQPIAETIKENKGKQIEKDALNVIVAMLCGRNSTIIEKAPRTTLPSTPKAEAGNFVEASWSPEDLAICQALDQKLALLRRAHGF